MRLGIVLSWQECGKWIDIVFLSQNTSTGAEKVRKLLLHLLPGKIFQVQYPICGAQTKETRLFSSTQSYMALLDSMRRGRLSGLTTLQSEDRIWKGGYIHPTAMISMLRVLEIQQIFSFHGQPFMATFLNHCLKYRLVFISWFKYHLVFILCVSSSVRPGFYKNNLWAHWLYPGSEVSAQGTSDSGRVSKVSLISTSCPLKSHSIYQYYQ